jgi:putative hydrolase of the HAD superfamily
MASAGLDGLVDVMVTSARAGARKPHPRIFRYTLDACGVDAADTVFVGDSWGPDVEGPAALGMRAVHVWRPEWDGEREPPPPVTDGVVRVPDLQGLLDLV